MQIRINERENGYGTEKVADLAVFTVAEDFPSVKNVKSKYLTEASLQRHLLQNLRI